MIDRVRLSFAYSDAFNKTQKVEKIDRKIDR